MNELSNARELSQPKENSASQVLDFNPFTASSASSFTSDNRSSAGIASSIIGKFPDAQDLLGSLSGRLHEDEHLKGGTIELGTVPYLDGIDPKDASHQQRQKLIDLLKKFNEV